jgi:DNA-binding PadR family transcriptional regulator
MYYLISTWGQQPVALEYAILGFLSERPRSGYDLKVRCFDGDARSLWSADQAQIYRTLDRLRAASMITRSRRRSQGRPDRLVYDVTDAGRDALTQWLSSAAPLPPSRDPFALQLYFGTGLDDETLAALISDRRAQHQQRLEALRDRSDSLAADTSLPARTMVVRQTALDGALARERTAIDWLDDCLEAIEHGALPEVTHVVAEGHLPGA